MGWIDTVVRRPVTIIMAVSVFVVLGFVGYRRMVVNLMPDIDLPLAQIISVYPGAGPEEIESQMVRKIEDEVSNISDIKAITSKVYEGYAWTMVEFNLGVDINVKALEVKDKVELIKRDLPPASEDPVIAKYDPLSVPVMKLALRSKNLSGTELYELADKKLKDPFGQISGVAKVDVLGGSKRQINVWASLDKLSQYGLSILDLFPVIGQQNLDIPAGNLKQKTREIGVRFKGEARTPKEIANLTFPVPRRGGGVIRLGDVARVEDGSEEAKSVVRFAGENAVILDVYKRSDGNTLAVADGTYQKIKQVQKLLPEGTEIIVADDGSTYIRAAVKEALKNIFLGVLLCALLLWIFLRDIRVTFVAAVVIPTSIISAFMLMSFAHFSVNVLTLSALGISIGPLVANAIVVLENIIRHVEKGTEPREAAVVGTQGAQAAVLATGGAHIVVFAPIAFMGGIVGMFFFQFGLTVVFATIFSIFASFTITPMLAANLIKPEGEKKDSRLFRFIHLPLEWFHQGFESLQAFYARTLVPVLKHPYLTNLVTLVVFLASLFLMRYVGGEFFPRGDQNAFMVQAQLPKGATEQAAGEVLSRIEAVVKAEIPNEMLDYTAQAGGENIGFDEAQVRVRLIDMEKRTRSDLEIMSDLQPALAKIPGAEINVAGVKRAGPSDSFDVEIYGPDYQVLAGISREIREVMMATGNYRSVFNTFREPKDEVHFLPDAYRRSKYGVPNAALGMTLRNSIEGGKAGVLRMGGEEYELKVRLEESNRNSVEDLKTYQVPTQKGPVPLSTLGTFQRARGIANLARKDKARVITLQGYISRMSQSENAALIKEKLKDFKLPPGYYYKFGRTEEMRKETSANIGFAFILAVILTYMLLAAILDSMIHPLTIMAAVPLGLVGVIVSLFFFGTTLNIMSMMAIVMLVGIVVNNSILIIDYAMTNIRNEAGDLAFCVQDAAVIKFRAVMMTTLAVIVGILPQLPHGSGSEFMRPIAVATIGGVGISAFFTFYTIPALFLLVESFTQKIKKRLGMGEVEKEISHG
ncbi:MAG: efflux RND transporter permease subunit [bacterium]|nr:efflux RND transporter permease subunit [bacterium]